MISFCIKNQILFLFSICFVFCCFFIPSYASEIYGGKYEKINCDYRFCIIKSQNKLGIIENEKNSENLKISLHALYDDIKQVNTSSYNMYIVKKNNKYGLYLSMFKPFKQGFLLPVEYDEIEFIHNTLFFKLRKGNKYSLYYAHQKQLSEEFDKFINTKFTKNEYVITKKNNKYGIICTVPYSGITNKTLPCNYDYIEPINYNMIFKVKNDKGKYALYNLRTGKFSRFEDNDNFFQNDGGRFFIIKKNGKFSLYETGSEYSPADKYIVENCDSINQLKMYFPEVYKIKKGNKYAFYSASRNYLSWFIYSDIKEDSYEYFWVKTLFWHREKVQMDKFQQIMYMSNMINKKNEYKAPKTKLIEIDEKYIN